MDNASEQLLLGSNNYDTIDENLWNIVSYQGGAINVLHGSCFSYSNAFVCVCVCVCVV